MDNGEDYNDNKLEGPLDSHCLDCYVEWRGARRRLLKSGRIW